MVGFHLANFSVNEVHFRILVALVLGARMTRDAIADYFAPAAFRMATISGWP